MDIHKPITAFLGPMYVGTSNLERPLTAAEKKELASHLRKHKFADASLIALNFAFKLTRNQAAAQDLQGRAHVRLIEQGWDPNVVTLTKCLCRFVWSEHTHARREDATRREAERRFVHEQGISHSAAPSVEDLAVRLETETEDEDHAKHRTEQLRAAFLDAKDAVNLQWLDCWLDGIDEPAEMARRSGLDVREFYRAADRRNRHVKRLLAAERGEKPEEDA